MMQDQDEGLPFAARACILLVGAAIVSPVVYWVGWFLYHVLAFIWLPYTPPPPTAEEKAIEASRQRDEQTTRLAFLKEQTPLWKTPATQMTGNRVAEEMSKCQAAARQSTGSPYEMLFDNYDSEQTAKKLREGARSIKIVGQQRHEFPNKVELATWWCGFEGTGYKAVRKERGSQFLDNYIRG